MSMITMRRLGRMGRWGNQLFQYMFIRTYAEKHGLNYQVPPWIGQSLFDLSDPIVTQKLPRYHEGQVKKIEHSSATSYQDAWNFPMPPDSFDVIDHDYHGYCQFHTSYFRPYKMFLQGLLKVTPEVEERTKLLRSYGQTTVGLHMRRGDTGRAIFYLTPNEWYLSWLEEHWKRLHNPVLVIATEEPSDVEAFAKYNPITAKDLLPLNSERYSLYNYLQCDLDNPTQENMDWFPDWYFLTQCNVLLIGESTFSFSAAMMNQRLQECWRSALSKQTFTKIDPWDSYPLLREHLDDYPNIPGTSYTENPKWQGGEVVST